MKNKYLLIACIFFIVSNSAKAQLLKGIKNAAKEQIGIVQEVSKGNFNSVISQSSFNTHLLVSDAEGIIVKKNDMVLTGIISFYDTSSGIDNIFLKIKDTNNVIKYIAKKDLKAFIYDGKYFYNSSALDENIKTSNVLFERESDGDCQLYMGHKYDIQTKKFVFLEAVMVNKENEKLIVTSEYFGQNADIKKWMLQNFSDYKPLIDYVKSTKDTKLLKSFFDAYNSKSMDPINKKSLN